MRGEVLRHVRYINKLKDMVLKQYERQNTLMSLTSWLHTLSISSILGGQHCGWPLALNDSKTGTLNTEEVRMSHAVPNHPWVDNPFSSPFFLSLNNYVPQTTEFHPFPWPMLVIGVASLIIITLPATLLAFLFHILLEIKSVSNMIYVLSVFFMNERLKNIESVKHWKCVCSEKKLSLGWWNSETHWLYKEVRRR